MKTKFFHTRKNKNYTSIILDEISEIAFIKAYEKMKEIHSEGGLAVVNIAKRTWAEFLDCHTLKIEDLKLGDEIKLLGTTFKVVQEYDENRKGNPLCEVEAYVRNSFGKDDVRHKERWGIFANGKSKFAGRVIENCYLNVTGSLLGY